VLNSKDRYLQHKELMKTTDKNQNFSSESSSLFEPGKKKRGSTQKKERTFLEKLVIFLILGFILSVFMAFALENGNIMVYDGIINFLILGSVTAVRPQMIVETMQRNNPRFNEIYGERIKGLTIAIRIFGLFFLALGVYSIYALII